MCTTEIATIQENIDIDSEQSGLNNSTSFDKPCFTQWTVRVNCFREILQNYKELLQNFVSAKNLR